ncbi:MFS transporter [Effusibacillus pohliae]|uniref:MFS transporter n=1 Tax=Effusibacillus pohliae TaxID=232270 RepID=UPI000366D5CD|nr:MFS transporter [Effusibacillus pohliae]
MLAYRDWSKSMRMLLWIGVLFTMASALSSAFVNVFLWKQTKSLLALAVYNGLQYSMMPLVFFVASRLYRVHRETYLRVGIFLHALFYGLVLWAGHRANPYWMGLLLGAGTGFYWYGYNLLSLRLTESRARGEFSSWTGMFGSVATMAAPLISGFLITSLQGVGYTLVFSLSLGFFAAALVVSHWLDPVEETELPMPVFRRQHPNWNRVLMGNFFQGVREGVFVFFAAIMVMITTGSEWGLGKYTAVNALLSSLSFFAVGKWLRWRWYNESMLIGSFLSSGAIALFLFEQNYKTIMLYGMITAIFTPLFAVPFAARAFHVIDEAHERYEREYIVEREIVLNAGRVLSIASFISTYRYLPKEWIPAYLLLIGSMQILAVLVLRSVGFRLKKMWEDA